MLSGSGFMVQGLGFMFRGFRFGGVGASLLLVQGHCFRAKREQLKGFTDFCLKARARIWP